MSSLHIKTARQDSRVYLYLEKFGVGFVNVGLPIEDAKRFNLILQAAIAADSSEARINSEEGGMGIKESDVYIGLQTEGDVPAPPPLIVVDSMFGANLCKACQASRHDHCGAQVSTSGIKCECPVCWGSKQHA